jgi:hypothetical protein
MMMGLPSLENFEEFTVLPSRVLRSTEGIFLSLSETKEASNKITIAEFSIFFIVLLFIISKKISPEDYPGLINKTKNLFR